MGGSLETPKLKQSGPGEPDPTGQPIPPDHVHACTWSEDLRTGRLIDAGAMAAEAGFCLPVALTAAAWSDCVHWSLQDSRRQLKQHERNRLWKVLEIAASAYVISTDPGAEILFPVFRIPLDGLSTEQQEVGLKAIIETAAGEPVVTIMLQNEHRPKARIESDSAD